MANNKNYVVFYNESKEIVGYREHHFDWEEGDTITTNGVKTTIFCHFPRYGKELTRSFGYDKNYQSIYAEVQAGIYIE